MRLKVRHSTPANCCQPGDTLVTYSDGVLESCNPSGEEFGSERLTAALRRAKQQSAHATLMMLLAIVQDFANGSSVCDDISVTVIQRDAECNRHGSIKTAS